MWKLSLPPTQANILILMKYMSKSFYTGCLQYRQVWDTNHSLKSQKLKNFRMNINRPLGTTIASILLLYYWLKNILICLLYIWSHNQKLELKKIKSVWLTRPKDWTNQGPRLFKVYEYLFQITHHCLRSCFQNCIISIQ